MKKRDAAIVGEIYVDHVMSGFVSWPQPGEEVFTDRYAMDIGGGGAITACALGRLGRSVTLIGAVGAEELPWLESRLASFNVSCDGLASGRRGTGVTVSVSTSEDRSFFTYVGENALLEEHLLSEAVVRRLVEARHVHFAMPLSAQTADVLLPELRREGCSVSLDVGHHVAWLRDPQNARTCAAADFLLPNEREAEILCGTDVGSFLDFTRVQGWRNGVVKLGARGAAMRRGTEQWRVESPRAAVVDTTGAGDAFDAGFIDGLLDGASGEECLRRGCICGSLSTRVTGTLRGLPDAGELRESYEQSYR